MRDVRRSGWMNHTLFYYDCQHGLSHGDLRHQKGVLRFLSRPTWGIRVTQRHFVTDDLSILLYCLSRVNDARSLRFPHVHLEVLNMKKKT